MLQSLKTHWRAVAVVVAVCLAFAAGRFATPTKVLTKDKVVYQDRVVTKTVEVKGEDKTVDHVVYVDRSVVTHPDGSTVHRDITRTERDTGDRTTEVARSTNSQTTTRVEEHTKLVEHDAPRWVASIGIGVPLVLKMPPVGTPFFLAEASYRFAGPFYVGPWFTLDLDGKNPALGVSVYISF